MYVHGTQGPRISRTKTGCLTCRRRRVKCDETRPECQRCRGLSLDCEWPLDMDSTRQQRSGSRSLRRTEHDDRQHRESRTTACQACREAKVRCSRTKPVCERCATFGYRCGYGTGATSGTGDESNIGSPVDNGVQYGNLTSGPSSSQRELSHGSMNSGTMANMGASRDSVCSQQAPDILDQPNALNRHLDAFFNHIHTNTYLAFIHRATLDQAIRAGRAPRHLLLAMSAVASPFVTQREDENRGGRSARTTAQGWAEEAQRIVLAEIGNIKHSSIATLLLLGYHANTQARLSLSWMLTPIASRMAYALRLNDEGAWRVDERTETRKEIRRRLMWACFASDTYACGGIQEFTTTPRSSMKVRLPSDEQDFVYGKRSRMPFLWQDSVGVQSTGYQDGGEAWRGMMSTTPVSEVDNLLSCQLRLYFYRAEILRYTKGALSISPPWDETSHFAHLCEELRDWKERLPPELVYSEENLRVRSTTRQLTGFVMLHCWWEQCHSDLYRIALPGLAESAPQGLLLRSPSGWIEEAQRACFAYAAGVYEPVRLAARVLPDFVIESSTFGLLAYESIRVQLQFYFVQASSCATDDMLVDLMMRFEGVTNLLEKLLPVFPAAKAFLEEIYRMLARHGFPTRPSDGRTHTMGTQTPVDDGLLLSKLHAVRALQKGRPRESDEMSRLGETVTSNQAGSSSAGLGPTLAPLRSRQHTEDILDGHGPHAAMPERTSVEELDQILSVYQEQVAFPDLFDLIGIAPGWIAEGSGGAL